MAASETARPLRLGGGVAAPYPMPSTAAATAVMRGNRSRDTTPEVRLRSALHRRGLRFRKHVAIATAARPVRPDVVFPRQRVAVFVDGCFWHGCPEHGTWPAANSAYWTRKLDRNQERDRETTRRLTDDGWVVLRFWEHADPDRTADAITRTLERM